MTLSNSHGKVRNERPRDRELGTAASAEERRRQNHRGDGRFAPGNRAAVGRAAKAVIERPEAGLLDALATGPDSPCEPSEAQALAMDVRALYRAGRRDVASESPMVLSAVATWARQTVISGHYLALAAANGIASPEGLAFIDAAQRAEKRGEDAARQAQALAVKLAKPGKVIDATPWMTGGGK